MIDIHSHILPGIDDGSKDVEMSLSMLRKQEEQRIEAIFLTPHFYADLTDPDTFLNERHDAYDRLTEALQQSGQEAPELLKGCEVHYYRGIGRSEEIERLCMGKSRYMLLEPTFREWTPAMIDDIKALTNYQDIKVIIAHIERYLDQDKRLVRTLIEDPDIRIQANAEFFLERGTRRKAMKMLKKGEIDFLGSDSHNLTNRVPNLGPALEEIEDALGTGVLERIEYNNMRLLDEAR